MDCGHSDYTLNPSPKKNYTDATVLFISLVVIFLP
jgi:hypothetical protein